MVVSYLDRAPPTVPMNQLQYSYRGFTIFKKPAYNLLYIEPPEGKRLVSTLQGDFMGPRVLEAAINTFLETHTVDQAFEQIPPEKPKRGRPKSSGKEKDMTLDDFRRQLSSGDAVQ